MIALNAVPAGVVAREPVAQAAAAADAAAAVVSAQAAVTMRSLFRCPVIIQ